MVKFFKNVISIIISVILRGSTPITFVTDAVKDKKP